MHYYGTYAIARIAGFSVDHAKTIAYSSQYVDDSTSNNSDEHQDGGMIVGIATAHHNSQVVTNNLIDKKEQKQVWVPFHFIPGGQGDTVSQKLVCQKDSTIANEMFENHISHAKKSDYGLHLIGIACHVFTDTFSHYGFSGVGSSNNEINVESIELIDVKNPEMRAFLTDKFGRFMRKYAPTFVIENWRIFAGSLIEKVSGSLGHGAVSTYPDRPFLQWKFEYKTGAVSTRNNPETFLEGCEKLYNKLVHYGETINPNHIPLAMFSDVKESINNILRQEKVVSDRIDCWRQAITSNQLYSAEINEALTYNERIWEKEKHNFPTLDSSAEAVNLDVYKFHQAATYHRYFVLKKLLPKHNIVVF